MAHWPDHLLLYRFSLSITGFNYFVCRIKLMSGDSDIESDLLNSFEGLSVREVEYSKMNAEQIAQIVQSAVAGACPTYRLLRWLHRPLFISLWKSLMN